MDVGSRKFEELCRDVVNRRFPNVVRASLKRTAGVDQYGVDVEGFDSEHLPRIVVSAKCYKDIKAWEFRPWIEDFTKHLDGHWKDKGVTDFVLAVSHECNDDDMNDASKLLVEDLRRRNINFHLWNSYSITEFLREDASLVGRYFGPYWVDAISASAAVTSATVETPTPLVSPLAQNNIGVLAQIVDDVAARLSLPLNTALAGQLDDALRKMRAGSSVAMRQWLASVRGDAGTWPLLPADTRAKALRAAAMLQLRDDQPEVAEELLSEAARLAPAPDRSVGALMTRRTLGPGSALECLTEPCTAREREIKAGLLIETSRIVEAGTILGEFEPENISAEVLRLRAIVEALSGRVDKALSLATNAHQRAPQDAIPLLTLGAMRLFAALGDGVTPQFGSSPNPMNAALLRGNKSSLERLRQSSVAFDQLLLFRDLDIKEDVEIWKLGALLMHPERHEEARSFARVLLNRQNVNPLAIAWCHQFNVPLREGKLRKVLGDAIRQGRGSPSHVVVLALMCAKPTEPGPGLAIISRFAHLFPEASDFLDGWREQFGDASSGAAIGYPQAVNSALRNNDLAPLADLLMRSDTPVENVIAGAAFLSQRRAYEHVNSLRERLIGIGTINAIELAAIAALRVGKPQDCISIITGSFNYFDGHIPTNLIHLRIQANTDLGSHRPVIFDLQALRSERDDPEIRDRLMDAYLKIGALREFQAEAERALDEGRLDQRHAMQIAYALRAHAPETAKRALSAVGQREIPQQLAGFVLSLSAELGLAELQDRVMRSMWGEGVPEGSTFVKFESVDAVLAYIHEQTDAYRKNFEEWLKGRALAAVIMRSDMKAYVRLFLESEQYRRNNAGDKFPVLLISAARRTSAPPIEAGRPPLRLDLSALLLLERFNLLAKVDQVFSVEVPPSLPEALIEITAEFRAVDKTMVQKVRDSIQFGVIKLVEDRPEGSIRLESDDNALQIDASRLQSALGAAVRNGNISSDDALRALQELGVDHPDLSGSWSAESLALSAFSIYRLASADVLEPVALAVPTLISRADADRVANEIDSALHDNEIRDRIVKLRATVAERLEQGHWQTIPRSIPRESTAEPIPPHVRCIIEILTAQESAAALFWIEDRFLSHQRLDGAVYLLDILENLENRSAIDRGAYIRLRKELRDTGYSFLPIEADEFFEPLDAALIVDGQIVEGPALADLRSWYVEELGRVQYLDLSTLIQRDGAIVSEMRRPVDLGALVRDVLSEVWSNPEADQASKIARSSWAWTCLRFEQPPVSTPAPAEARRRFVATMVAHAIDLPLVSKLSAGQSSKLDGRGFVNWFVRTVLDPLAEADQNLAEEVADALAATLSRLLEPRDDVPENLADELDARLCRAVQDLLDLLPDSWADRVASRHDLHIKLRHRTLMMLSVADGISVPVVSAAEALERSLGQSNGSHATVAIRLANGRDAEIDVILSSHGVPSVGLAADDERFRLDPVTTALLHPDPSVRAKVLAGIPSLSEREGLIKEADLDRLARIPGVEDRFEAFKYMLDGDFHKTIWRMRGIVEKNQPLSVSDLQLPDPDAIAEFMSVADIGEDANLECMGAAGARLISRIGMTAAVSRIAGSTISIPRELSVQIYNDFDDVMGENVSKMWSSPLLEVMKLEILATVSQSDVGAIGRAVRCAIDSVERLGSLFTALIRHGARQVARRADWQRLPEKWRVCFLWVYADQLTCALSPPNVDREALALWIKSISRLHFRDMESRSDISEWVRLVTLDYGQHRFATSVVARILSVLRNPNPELTQRLQSVCGLQGEFGWLPYADAIRPWPTAPSDFWVAADPIPLLIETGWVAADSEFTARTHTRLAERLLGQPADSPQRQMLPSMLTLVDPQQIEISLVDEIRATLDAFGYDLRAGKDDGSSTRVSGFRAELLAVQGDTDSFLRELNDRAEVCSKRWPYHVLFYQPDGEVGQAFSTLADAAFAHSMALRSSREERLSVFANSIRAIVDGWPNALRAGIFILDAVVRQLDVPAAEAIWHVLLDLRGRHSGRPGLALTKI